MLESTNRLTRASRSWRSPYRRVFSNEVAASEASSSEDGHSGGSKDVGCEIVFQVQHSDQSGLLEQWQAEHRSWRVLANIFIACKWALAGGVMQQHTLVGPEDVAKNGTANLQR